MWGSLDVPAWVSWVVGAAALAGAARTLYIYVIRPLAALVTLVEEHLPVLVAIAAEFAPDGGNTLSDRMDRVLADTEANSRAIRDVRVRLGRFEDWTKLRLTEANDALERITADLPVINVEEPPDASEGQ